MHGMFLIFLNALYLFKKSRYPSQGSLLKGCIWLFLSPFILMLILFLILRGLASIIGAG